LLGLIARTNGNPGSRWLLNSVFFFVVLALAHTLPFKEASTKGFKESIAELLCVCPPALRVNPQQFDELHLVINASYSLRSADLPRVKQASICHLFLKGVFLEPS
jgi:hypothetical protein